MHGLICLLVIALWLQGLVVYEIHTGRPTSTYSVLLRRPLTYIFISYFDFFVSFCLEEFSLLPEPRGLQRRVDSSLWGLRVFVFFNFNSARLFSSLSRLVGRGGGVSQWRGGGYPSERGCCQVYSMSKLYLWSQFQKIDSHRFTVHGVALRMHRATTACPVCSSAAWVKGKKKVFVFALLWSVSDLNLLHVDYVYWRLFLLPLSVQCVDQRKIGLQFWIVASVGEEAQATNNKQVNERNSWTRTTETRRWQKNYLHTTSKQRNTFVTQLRGLFVLKACRRGEAAVT